MSSNSTSHSDHFEFLQLPDNLRKLIDNAFNSNSVETPHKKRKLETDLETTLTGIPLAKIPTALSLLNLPPDDQEVLAVFQNAASGWSQPQQMDVNIGDQIKQQGTVSREDFQAICAALLDSGSAPEDTGTEGGGFLIDDTIVPEGGGFLIEDTDVLETSRRTRKSMRFSGSHMEEEESDFTPESEGEGYKDSYSESEEETSADEYVEGPSTRRYTGSRKSKFKLPSSSDDSGEEDLTNKPLSAHQQKDACLAFALFFPDVPSSDLEKQRIMIKDIDRVAKLLKEKLKAEEVSNT